MINELGCGGACIHTEWCFILWGIAQSCGGPKEKCSVEELGNLKSSTSASSGGGLLEHT